MKRYFLVVFLIGFSTLTLFASEGRASNLSVGCCKGSRAARAAEAKRKAEIRRIAMVRRRAEAALAIDRSFRNSTSANILKDNPTNEDPKIRQAAIDALGSHAGTVVVMNAQTGEIVTMVNQQWAIREAFKPCSTIKLVTGTAGLSENVIDEKGNIRDSSFTIPLNDALSYSVNAYFQKVGAKVGNNKMIEYAKTLGLGAPTGINAPGETAGRLPYGNNNVRIYSHGDDFAVSPLQLAVLVSEITNGGHKVVPQIPSVKKDDIKPKSKDDVIPIPAKDLEAMIPGMKGVADVGTAHKSLDSSLRVGGKTGSCIEKGTWIGLFTSVAPIEKPLYSVVVVARGRGERGKYAAAVAGKVYQALFDNGYFSPPLSPPEEEKIPDRLRIIQ